MLACAHKEIQYNEGQEINKCGSECYKTHKVRIKDEAANQLATDDVTVQAA